nr:BspA family leucine-rich repeat surface protein [Saprospiraceae bacterium]
WSSPETFQSYTFTGDDLGENFLFLVGLDEAGVTTSCKSTITVKELNPFVTTWKTDNPGTSDSLQVTLPIYQASSRDYRFDIDWGDGNFSYDRNASTTHTYDSAGVYTVRISGDFPRIYFNNEGDKEKLLTVEQWGDIQWSSMESAFHGCRHLNITNPTIDSPDLSNVISLANMFDKCYAFNGHISHWDVSSVQIFDEMFSFCTVFDQAIGAWDMRSARSLYFMLEEAHQFNQDLNAWDVSNVTIMDGLFYYALVFDQDLNNWDVSQVNSMVEMFYVANLFNGDITSWNVSHVENMEGMFEEAYAFNQDISNWEVGNVKDMSGMFGSTQRFNQDIGSWDVSQVTDMLGMFNGARVFNQDIGDWNVGKVTNMRNMFRSADAFNQDIGDWEVGNVTRMDAMFQESDLFNQDLASWDVSQVKDMRRMFENAASFDQDLGKWDIGGLADNVFSSGLEEMFKGAGLSVSNYDATLIGWHTDASGETGDGKDDIPYDIVFGAGNSQYCAGDSARQVLINTYRWSIMDAGQDCLTVNADDLTFGAEIKMYPNPSSNLIYFTGDLKDLRMVEIYGLNGQRLMVFKNNWNQVDISPLPPSIYFVKLVSEQSFKTFKLLKE